MYACTVLVQVLATPHKWCWWQWTSVIQLGVGVSEMISGVPQAPYRMYWHSIPKIRIHKLGLFECLPLSQHSKDPQFSHHSCYSGNRIVVHHFYLLHTDSMCSVLCVLLSWIPVISYFYQHCVSCWLCQVKTLSWMALLCRQVSANSHGASISPSMGEGSVVCEVNHATGSQLTAPWKWWTTMRFPL